MSFFDELIGDDWSHPQAGDPEPEHEAYKAGRVVHVDGTPSVASLGHRPAEVTNPSPFGMTSTRRTPAKFRIVPGDDDPSDFVTTIEEAQK